MQLAKLKIQPCEIEIEIGMKIQPCKIEIGMKIQLYEIKIELKFENAAKKN